MGLWDKLKGELIDVIEWIDQTDDTLVWKFERYGNEIKNGAKLIVRESQIAVFINEGELADIFGPGTYTLETQNLPILSTLKGWKYGFKSPFKADVFFVSTKIFKALKWGTPNQFYVRDRDFGRVSLRAFGTFSFKIVDAAKFIRDVSGTNPNFTTEDVLEELRSLTVQHFIDAVGKSGLSLLDFASNYSRLADECEKILKEEFKTYGIDVIKFVINSINLPKELEEKLNMGTGLNMIGNINAYQQMKMADAMEAGAQNPAGSTGGLENVLGLAFMNQMLQQQNKGFSQSNNMTPPPPPSISNYFVLINNQQIGPLSIEQISDLIQKKQISPDTYVWKQGMPQWAQCKTIPEIANLFSPIAPPPPPIS